MTVIGMENDNGREGRLGDCSAATGMEDDGDRDGERRWQLG
uniref:Uncharacterized protein n=1 Tax=Arundo donax TaxID=35708 RepID=A0A0A8Z3F8_ARUDO